MEKIKLEDIHSNPVYEVGRPDFLKKIIELKKIRRVSVGDKISLVFENRQTVLFQIQEMMRAEHIELLEKIGEEVDVYNDLIPDANELSATLFIEITDAKKLKREMDSFQGLDKDHAVFLKIGDSQTAPARFEPGRSREDRISAVHYLRFKFSPVAKRLFKSLEEDAQLVIEHRHYRKNTRLSLETQKSLARDL